MSQLAIVVQLVYNNNYSIMLLIYYVIVIPKGLMMLIGFENGPGPVVMAAILQVYVTSCFRSLMMRCGSCVV